MQFPLGRHERFGWFWKGQASKGIFEYYLLRRYAAEKNLVKRIDKKLSGT
jgi:hypothetical protein